MINVAIAQLTGKPGAADKNRASTVEHAAAAFRGGAQFVILPELIVPGYVLNGDIQRVAGEPLNGPTTTAWRSLAKSFGGYIAGGFSETSDSGFYNTAVLIGPEGVLIHYRKLHLFAQEKEIFTPGDMGLPVAETPFGTVGLCICYDLRFVEVARSLALRGVQLLAVPTAWVPGFDQQRWDAEGYCPQARTAAVQANLNQIFIACASQAGKIGDLEFLGSSLIADPYGKTVIGPLSGADQLVSATSIDLDKVRFSQNRSPLISPRLDRRTDVYGIWSEGRVL